MLKHFLTISSALTFVTLSWGTDKIIVKDGGTSIETTPYEKVTIKDGSTEIKVTVNEGALTLQEFLQACPDVANSTCSKLVDPKIPGQIVKIKGTDYEVRYFSFEDTKGTLSPQTTFQTYAQRNNLLPFKSVAMAPLPGIHFESFDFRRSNLNDGVYFSMAVRKVEK